MKKSKLYLKMITVAAMTLFVAVFAGCGTVDESKKAYLDEINVKDYVKLGEYKGLEVTQQDPVEITDDYRDSYINYVLSLDPEGGVMNGDTVNIDYSGKLDGVAFDGGTAAGQSLIIGSGQFIPGFEEGLIGYKVGDTVDIELTFPEEYHSVEMAGKTVIFTVTINSIIAAQPQELTDEYVQGLGIECSTIDEYKQYVTDMLQREEQKAYESNIENALVTSIMAACEFLKEPPQAMQDRYVETLTANLTSEAAYYGRSLEEFMQLSYGMDIETYGEEIRKQALKSAQNYVMLKAIADIEGIEVTEEELQTELEQKAAEVDYTVEEYKEAINERGYKEFMLGSKVLDLLRENAVVSAE